MKIDLSGLAQRDRDAIQALADSKDFSVQTLVVQALRLYQDTDRKLSDGEICTWSGDAGRAQKFIGTHAELVWDNGAEDWPYPLLALHKPSRSLVLFFAPCCGMMIQNRGSVLTKPGDFGTGYSMEDFIPYTTHLANVVEQHFAMKVKSTWEIDGLEAMNRLLTRTAEGRA